MQTLPFAIGLATEQTFEDLIMHSDVRDNLDSSD